MTRVLAIISCKDGVVESLGEGNYVGDFIPPENITKRFGEAYNEHPIPKIELDNGDVVWGCECLWTEADKMRKHFEGAEWRDVRIGDYRGKV
jgi:hypothetical protein